MPSLPMLMSTPSDLLPGSGLTISTGGFFTVGAGGGGGGITMTRRTGSVVSWVMRQVKGGRSCTMPTAASSSTDSTRKRRQLMLTSQPA